MEKIRKIIKEVLGVQSNIENITYEVMDWTYHILNFNATHNKTQEITPISSIIHNDESIKKTGIGLVKTNVVFKKSTQEKITGSFNPKKLFRNKEGNFEVELQLNIQTNNDINSDLIKNKVESIISHELNHAFVYIKKFNKKSKSQVLNRVKGMLGFEFQGIPELKEFIEMFYLNLPEEMQARVQETGTLLKRIKSNNYADTIKQLYLYQPINDAMRMVQYKDDNIKSLDKKILENFVDIFNKNIDVQKGEIEFKKIINVDKFFEYWINQIIYNGYQLNKKILKLVADKFNKTEKEHLNEIVDTGLFDLIFGGPF